MSFRSLSGLPINIRSLNGLEGVAIEQIIAGDAISVLDNSKAKKTINVNISKQTAVTTVADDDIFLLEKTRAFLAPAASTAASFRAVCPRVSKPCCILRF